MFPNKVLQKVSTVEILQNARVGTAVHCLPEWQAPVWVLTGACLLFCKEIPVVPRRISQVYIHLLCLLFSVLHNSKRHFLKWKSAATAALSAKKRNGRTLSMAAQPFNLTIDGVRPFCYSD